MKSITDSVLFIVLKPTEVDYLSSQSLEELERLRHLYPQTLAERNLKVQVCCNLLVHSHHSKHIKHCLTFLTSQENRSVSFSVLVPQRVTVL